MMPLTLSLRSFLPGLLALVSVLTPMSAAGWGYQGHAQVGRVALERLDPTAAERLANILQSEDPEALDTACSWPDVVRETPEWEWSAPLHYVNIPRSAMVYESDRDCPDGQCVSEAIKKYANELTLPGLEPSRYLEAASWLCHLVGDLHQPLHAGFKDDRGGNRVDVQFNGEELNLHAFWDSGLIDDRIGPDYAWPRPVLLLQEQPNRWKPAEADDWTSASHELAVKLAYPASPRIDDEFADRSWDLIQRQVELAGYRLARILNATIGDGEVLLH